MFTGIVQAKVKVAWVEHTPKLCHYALSFPSELLIGLQIGASVSVNGVCQTVVTLEGNEVTFQAIDETLKRTNLRDLMPGQMVNIERAAKIGDEIGGHLMSGHVMGMATLSSIAAPTPEQRIFTLNIDPQWIKYFFPKGFTGLNGVSLTVVEVRSIGEFTVHLIPETLRLTIFGEAKVGDKINFEIDPQTQMIVDTVEKVLSAR